MLNYSRKLLTQYVMKMAPTSVGIVYQKGGWVSMRASLAAVTTFQACKNRSDSPALGFFLSFVLSVSV